VNTTTFREMVQQLAGYDASNTGEILTLQQAFGNSTKK
jgi:hypothetical protein